MGFVVAQGQGVHEPGTGIENPEVGEAGQGTGQGLDDSEVLGAGVGKQVMAGNYIGEAGQQIRIQKNVNNRVQLRVNNISADCGFNLTQRQVQNRTVLETKLSNGRNAEIKVMPDSASGVALQRLGLKSCVEGECNIELKEVGRGEGIKIAYEVNTQRQSKFLGLFGARMQVQAQVDAETGEVIRVKKPWWAFLASESEEE